MVSVQLYIGGCITGGLRSPVRGVGGGAVREGLTEPAYHESGMVSTQVGGGAVFRHVGLLGRDVILLLLRQPAGGDGEYQALERGNTMPLA